MYKSILVVFLILLPSVCMGAQIADKVDTEKLKNGEYVDSFIAAKNLSKALGMAIAYRDVDKVKEVLALSPDDNAILEAFNQIGWFKTHANERMVLDSSVNVSAQLKVFDEIAKILSDYVLEQQKKDKAENS